MNYGFRDIVTDRRRGRAPGQHHRQGHDRRAHRAAAPYGRRGLARLLRPSPHPEDAAGPDHAPVHPPAHADFGRPLCLGLCAQGQAGECAGRWPPDLFRVLWGAQQWVGPRPSRQPHELQPAEAASARTGCRNASRQQRHGLCLPVRACLGEDALEVRAHRAEADVHLRGDLFQRLSSRQSDSDCRLRAGEPKQLAQLCHCKWRFGIADEDQDGWALLAEGRDGRAQRRYFQRQRHPMLPWNQENRSGLAHFAVRGFQRGMDPCQHLVARCGLAKRKTPLDDGKLRVLAQQGVGIAFV